MSTSIFWIYILECINGSYYTGYTTQLDRRYKEHQEGTAKCKYTRSFKPIKIAQSWQIQGDKSIAMKIEKRIKVMDKKRKKELILFPYKFYEIFKIWL